MVQEQLADARSSTEAGSDSKVEVEELKSKLATLTEQLLQQQAAQEEKADEVRMQHMPLHVPLSCV